MLASNTILQNRYRIVRQLGQGGMGTVYEAIDERLDTTFALKECHFTDEQLSKQFEREARLLARLRHPAMTRVIDHFQDDAGQFLVMDFIAGEDLSETLIKSSDVLPPSQVLAWADQLLDALTYLHSQEPPVIHRDIKPQNLKLTALNQIILLDFGLAKGFAGQVSRVTPSGSIFGYTPNYAPLEQIQGTGTDQRSDLYSLGATLYHLMTGTAPPDVLTRLTAITDGQSDPLRSANEIRVDLKKEVAAVLSHAMAIGRNQRFANAAEMRQAFREATKTIKTGDSHTIERPPLPLTITGPLPLRVQEQNAQGASPTIESQEIPPVVFKPPVASPTLAADVLARELTPSGTIDHQEKEKGKPSNRKLMIAVAAVIGIVLIVALGWMLFRGTGSGEGSQKVSDGQKATNQPTTGNANQPSPPAGMAYVLGGTFMMGRNDGDDYERPAHSVAVKPFFIDIYEVTNEEYMKFVQATNYKAPSGWANISYPAGATRKPVTGVTWDDANAYAKWAGKHLPTEEEWEFAARGTDGRRYPWGNEWQAGLANAAGASRGMADVGKYTGASPFGAFDMVGNAWEWTASRMTAYPGGTLPEKSSDDLKVIRGGTYSADQGQATTTFRRGWRATAEDDYRNMGFRCVQDIGNGK